MSDSIRRAVTTSLCIFSLGLQSCSSQNEKNTSQSGPTSQSLAGSLSGQLVLGPGIDDVSILANADIAIQDHPELTGKTGADGSFTISNIPTGTLSILVTSDSSHLSLAESAAYGVKVDDIIVRPGKNTDLGNPEMKATGTLKGKAKLFENPNNLDLAGTDIFIPGTSYIAKTSDDGSFVISGLPEGTYALYATRSGFATLKLNDLDIKSGEINDLGDIHLSLSQGPEGSITAKADKTTTIQGTLALISLSRSVTFELTYDSDAALMKISDEPAFLNKSWETVKNTVTKTYTSDGKKTLYVMYSDLNGLESSPFMVEVYVDTEVPTISSFQIMNGWSQISATATTMPLSVDARDTGAGVEKMMFSNSSTFASNSGWLDFNSEYAAWSAAPNTWVKVRDYAGRESVVATDSIIQGSYTVIDSGTYDSLTLKKTHSPFKITGALTIENDFVVEPGVVMDANLLGGSAGVTIKGLTKMVGTATNPITFTSSNSTNGFLGFDLSQSKSEDNEIAYFEYQEGEMFEQLFKIDGGSIHHCTLNFGSKGFRVGIEKSGYRRAEITYNTISQTGSGGTDLGLKLGGPENAAYVAHNDITFMYHAIEHVSGDESIVEYNTISLISTSGAGPAVVAAVDGASPIYRYNDLTTSITSGGGTVFRAYSGAGTVMVYHNNLTTDDHNWNSHIEVGSANMLFNADLNYYIGCGTLCAGGGVNPQFSGSEAANVTNTSSQGSAWPTTGTKASGCVGHQCTD